MTVEDRDKKGGDERGEPESTEPKLTTDTIKDLDASETAGEVKGGRVGNTAGCGGQRTYTC
jgi:hypothetical protein